MGARDVQRERKRVREKTEEDDRERICSGDIMATVLLAALDTIPVDYQDQTFNIVD